MNFDQIIGIVSAVTVSLVSAIVFLAKWILNQITTVKNDLLQCEEKHDQATNKINELAQKSSFLEGKLNQMETHNQQFEVILKLLKKISGGEHGDP